MTHSRSILLLALLTVGLSGCRSDDEEPSAPTISVAPQATISGPVPTLVGDLAVDVGGTPATIAGGRWTATVTAPSGLVPVTMTVSGVTVDSLYVEVR